MINANSGVQTTRDNFLHGHLSVYHFITLSVTRCVGTLAPHININTTGMVSLYGIINYKKIVRKFSLPSFPS